MNCDICRKDCSSDFVTADCTFHYLCGTCTAVFLNGLSSTPTCHKCVARDVYEKYAKCETTKRRPKLKAQHLTLSPRKLACGQDKIPSLKPPSFNSSETLTPTSTESNFLGPNPNLLVKRNKLEKCHIQLNDIPFTDEKGNVSYKIDMFTGKMVRFYPYTPKKVKNTSEKIKQKFEEVSPQTKEEISNSVTLKTNIPSNNSSYCAEADMQYIDNLFSFLREEKSKRQKFAVPSIKSKYDPDELEFNIKRGEQDPTCFSSQSSPLSCKKDSRIKPPALNTLLCQIQPDMEDDGLKEDESEVNSSREYDRNACAERHPADYEMSLMLGQSMSPASDVKGEYGSEDDKQSISSGSGSTGPNSDQQRDRSDSGSEYIKSSTTEPERVLRNKDQEGNGYNADGEEERCSSPCKGAKLNYQEDSYYWDQEERDENEAIPTLPEPPRRSAAAVASSSEEDDSAEIQALCNRSTETDIKP